MRINYRSTGSTLVSYSELNITGTYLQDRIDGGWRSVTSSATALAVGKGYRVFAGLDNSDDAVSVTGAPQVGNFSVGVTYTPTATEGWNLLGNPYACEINFDAVHSANSSVIEASMYIMDAYNTSSSGVSYDNENYLTYNVSSGIVVDPRKKGGGNGTARTAAEAKFIASSQGFFVIAKASGSVNFTESMKPASAYSSVYGNFREEAKELIRLDYTDSVTNDQTVVHFNSAALDGFDNYDAIALSSNIYTTVSNKKLAINCQSGFNSNLRIPLVVSNKVLGRKSISVSEQRLGGRILYLYDNYKKVLVRLDNKTKYEFEHTSDSASRSVKRFVLTTDKPIITGVYEGEGNSFGSSRMEIHPNPYSTGMLTLNLNGSTVKSVDVEVLDLNGSIVYSTTLSSTLSNNGTSFELNASEINLSAGVYTVKCITSGKTFAQRLVVSK